MLGVLVISVITTFVLGWMLVKRLFPWLSHDLRYMSLGSKMMKSVQHAAENHLTFPNKLEEMANKHPNKDYLIFGDESFSYKDMNDWVNRMTRALSEIGVKKDDQVALLMYNCPAFPAVLFSCMRLGAELALINYNHRSTTLMHSLMLTGCKLVIVGEEDYLLKAVMDIREEMDISVISFSQKVGGLDSLKEVTNRQSAAPLEANLKPKLPFSKTACYIFTSGTTGLPKAVKMSYRKLTLGSHISDFCKFRNDDIVYCALPFYHTAGSMAGLLTVLCAGVTIAIRRNFSASQCIPDCRKYNATVLQYIGETMRYICLQPERAGDREHNLRMAYGNGMRKDVWLTFLDRFGPDIEIYEFYAATESNSSFVNLLRIPGAVGMCSPLMKKIAKLAFVRYDHEEGGPYRNSNGRCVEVGLNEAGLVLGKIHQASSHCEYKGDKKLTEKKILRDVFEEGDAYYNSGDLLLRDENYVVYFVDRVGDTFRWKGENVSTNEVADVISACPTVKEVTVYGVRVKGQEGRAGMAAVTLQDEANQLELEAFYDICKKKLPKYALPLFIRVQKNLAVTGTMKQIKVKLREEGYDVTKMGGDNIFFLHPQLKSYVPLTIAMQKEIDGGQVKI